MWDLYPSEGADYAVAVRGGRGDGAMLLGCDRLDSRPAAAAASTTTEDDGDAGVNGCRTLVGHGGPVFGVAFVEQRGGDSRHLLSAGEDCSMRIWEVAGAARGGGKSCRAVYRGHAYPIWCMDVDRLGINVITGELVVLPNLLQTCSSIVLARKQRVPKPLFVRHLLFIIHATSTVLLNLVRKRCHLSSSVTSPLADRLYRQNVFITLH